MRVQIRPACLCGSRVGSGRVRKRSGRVGSENFDPIPPLLYLLQVHTPCRPVCSYIISNKLYSGSNAMVAEWEMCETRAVVANRVSIRFLSPQPPLHFDFEQFDAQKFIAFCILNTKKWQKMGAGQVHCASWVCDFVTWLVAISLGHWVFSSSFASVVTLSLTMYIVSI